MINWSYQLVIDNMVFALLAKLLSELAFTCLKSTAEKVEQDIRYVPN